MPPIKLQIKCAGRRVNHLTLKPVGRKCGRVFETAAKFRSRRALVELARTAGWRVAPLRRGPTVEAMCPKCSRGATQ